MSKKKKFVWRYIESTIDGRIYSFLCCDANEKTKELGTPFLNAFPAVQDGKNVFLVSVVPNPNYNKNRK